MEALVWMAAAVLIVVLFDAALYGLRHNHRKLNAARVPAGRSRYDADIVPAPPHTRD
jgi:hypothetical protein